MKRLPLAILMAAFFVLLLWAVSVRQALLFAIGIGMGAALAGARFGFTTGWRQLIEHKDPRGVTGQIALLAVAAILAMPLLANYTELTAALGPPSVSLIVGAFVFGLTMQIADGCGSGTLYKAGLGIPMNMGILPLFAAGSFLGSVHIGDWLSLGQTEPIGLVNSLGLEKALAVTLVGLIALLVAVRLWVGKDKTWLDSKWLWGALALAFLATLNLIVAGQPWGVVYGFGLWAAKIAQSTSLFDPSGNFFWSQDGNAQILAQTVLLDVTSITNIGILAGALWISAKSSGNTTPLTRQQWVIGLAAGFLMGYSSRLAFGCNIGAMLSGVSTGSLHGWIWIPLAFAGTWIGVRVRRHYRF
jgi:uncharacterized protein